MKLNLRPEDVEAVLGLLDGWPGSRKLTWPALVEVIQAHLGRTWSRQALDRHARIKDAYKLRKGSLRAAGPRTGGDLPPELQRAQEAIDRLEAEIARLKNENQRLQEQFIRWTYNAHAKGISEEVLNQPLPNTGRVSTRR